MHHRDLAGRAAEAQDRDPHPDAHGLAEGRIAGRFSSAGAEAGSDFGHVRPAGLRTASCGSRRWRRGTSDRARRRAACRPRAARDRRRTFATGRARRRAGPGLPARDRAVRCRRRGRSWRGGAAAGGRPNSSSIVSKVQVSPRWLQNTPSTSNGVGGEPFGDGRDIGRRDEQEHRRRIDEAADQPRAGDAVDLRPRARHPHGAAVAVARRQLGGGHQRQPGLPPGLKAAFQRLGLTPRAAARRQRLR